MVGRFVPAFPLGFGLFSYKKLQDVDPSQVTEKEEHVVKGIWQQGHTVVNKNHQLFFFASINLQNSSCVNRDIYIVKSYSHSSPSLIPNKSSNLLKHVIWFLGRFSNRFTTKIAMFLSPSGKLQPTCHVILRTQPGDQILSGSVHEFMQGLQILVVVFAFPHGII